MRGRGDLPRRRKSEDAELSAGSLAHYGDPAYYDKTYAKRLEDVAYYVALAKQARGAVLEYGCGNGRITIPIAQAGRRVTGVDHAPVMLTSLRAKLRETDRKTSSRVSIRRGDMRSLRLTESYALAICPFNAFLHLYTRRDVERFLARVRAHLTPRGRFVFDVSMPEPEEQSRDPERPYYTPRFRYPGAGTVRYRERFEYDKLRQVLFIGMEFLPMDGSPTWVTPLTHRQFFPQELEALLHYNGFRIDSLFENYTDRPATVDAHTLVYHCRLRTLR